MPIALHDFSVSNEVGVATFVVLTNEIVGFCVGVVCEFVDDWLKHLQEVSGQCPFGQLLAHQLNRERAKTSLYN